MNVRLDTLWTVPTRRRTDFLSEMLCDFPRPLGKVRAQGASGAELERLLSRCAAASIVSMGKANRHGGYWMIDHTRTRVGDHRAVPVLRWHRNETLEERRARYHDLALPSLGRW